MYYELLVCLVKKFCEFVFGDFEKRVIFGLIGSDVNDGIIKFVRVYIGCFYIISFINVYYGLIFGLLFMLVISLNMCKYYGLLLNGFYYILFLDKYCGMYE